MIDSATLVDWLQKKLEEEDAQIDKHARSRSEEAQEALSESIGREDAFAQVLAFVSAMEKMQEALSKKDPKAS